MRRFFSVALIFALLLSLTACGSSPNSGPSLSPGSGQNSNLIKPGDPSNPATEPTDKIPNDLAGLGNDSDSTDPNDPDATGSEHNPEATGSDPEDFWLADDYFDLEKYVNTLNCTDVVFAHYEDYNLKGEIADMIWQLKFNMNNWRICFSYHEAGLMLINDAVKIDCQVEPDYNVILDNLGSYASRSKLDAFIEGIELLKTASSDGCPLCGLTIDEIRNTDFPHTASEPFAHIHYLSN